MKNVIFFNGQSNEVAEIVRASMPEGFEMQVYPGSLTDAEKGPLLEIGGEYLILHPAQLSKTAMAQARNLRHIQLLTAGYDKVDVDAARLMNVSVATNGGTNAWAVAEHTVALLLVLYKKLIQCDQSVRAGTWRKPITGMNTFELAGKKIGLIGVGKIGTKVAKRLKAFETEILFVDQYAVSGPEFDGQCVTLETLLRESDVISIHVPLTTETRGMIGASEFAQMKQTAVLLNTSRAEVVDDEALEKALRDGRIAGAGLDVYYQEPILTTSGLLSLENVVLSPHTAGHSYEAWFRRARFAWENIQRVADGTPPTSLAG